MRVRWQSEIQLNRGQIVELLREFGDLLPDPLSERVDLDVYTEKILAHADIAFAFIDETIAGMIVLYANDTETRAAHVPLVAVAPFAQGYGVGRAMVTKVMICAASRGMTRLHLNVLKANAAAISFYEALGFSMISDKGEKQVMQIDLSYQMPNEPVIGAKRSNP